MSAWTYQGVLFESEDIGAHNAFVYRITNKTDNRFYIGKKLFWSTTTRPPLKGKKRKRKVTKESDWKDYFGSSKSLQADVEEFGRDNFTREIIYLAVSKAESSYMELWHQINEDVLFRDDSYNGIVSVRIGSNAFKKVRSKILCETNKIIEKCVDNTPPL